MSGGSFNYLCRADAADLFSRTEDLARMADSMTRRGMPDAAAEVEYIAADMAAFLRRTEVRLQRLHDLMRAIEWHESGDYGPEQVAEELERYRTPPAVSPDPSA